jgi:adenylate cyclase
LNKKYIFPALLIGLALPLLMQLTPLEILKLKTFDAFVKEQDPTGNFVILDITEADIEKEGGWPLPRRRLAEIQVDLLNAGSYSQAWALTFPQPDRLGGDEAFAEALSYGPSVLAMFESDTGNYPPTVGTVILGEDTGGGYEARGVVENIDILKENASQGVASAPTDVDGLVRQYPLLLRTETGFAPSLPIEIIKKVSGADTYIINMSDGEIRVPSLPPISVDSAHRKWISYVNTPVITLDDLSGAKDKITIIGTSGGGIMPQVPTSKGLMYPHYLQAAVAESILIEDSPRIPEWHLGAELAIFVLLALMSWFLTQKLSMSVGLIYFGISASSVAAFGYYTIQDGLLLDVTWSLISQFIIGSTSYYLKYREEYILRQQIKKQFEHYLDKRQVQQLQDNPDLLKLGGSRRYITVLFTDVRGFTSMSESMSAEDVTYIMNRALTAQVEAVKKYGGMVDKFIGDALMAVFSAPLDLENHESKAIECAIQMQKNMEDLNIELEEEGLPPVAIGIGINSGEAIVGNMGSDTRFDYTCIGSPVNEAARLESSCKEVGVDLIIGRTTALKSDYTLKELDPIKVKGVERPLVIYTLLDN